MQNIEESLQNMDFQMAISRHVMGNCSVNKKPKITVFDNSYGPIDPFLEFECKHTKDWFKQGKTRPDALDYRQRLMKLFRKHINPLSSLVREIKNENGGLFYAILPCGNVNAPWQQAFRSTMSARNFTVWFMYGVQKSSYVYVVFGLCAEKRLNISSAGVGKALGKIFTKKCEKTSFISIVCLSSVNCVGGETWLALALAHIACKRCACIGDLSEFDQAKGDIGSAHAAFAVDYIRATSFPLALCGSLNGLTPADAAERKEWITAALRAKNLPLPWGNPTDAWCPQRKRASVVSVLFQANTLTGLRLLRELETYAVTLQAQISVAQIQDGDTSGICLHAVFVFKTPIEPNKQFLDGCIRITKEVRKCTMMSVTPIEYRTRRDKDLNLFADAVLASFNPDPSSVRDDLFNEIHPLPFNEPNPLPLPPPPRQPPPPAPKPAPRDPRLMNQPEKKKNKFCPPAQEKRPPHAKGYLLGQILEAEIQNAPGTPEYDQEVGELVKYVHDWFFNVLDFEPQEVPLFGEEVARVTLSNTLLSCMQIFADNMRRCGKSVYFASLSFKLAVTEGRNTIQDIHNDLKQAHEICRGLERFINSLRFMEEDQSEEFRGVGVKRAAEACSVFVPPEAPKPILPEMIAKMSEFNLVKRIYMDIQRAHDKLYDTCPDDGMLIDWDRVCRNVGELKDILFEGTERCKALLDFIGMEGVM